MFPLDVRIRIIPEEGGPWERLVVSWDGVVMHETVELPAVRRQEIERALNRIIGRWEAASEVEVAKA